MIAGSDARQHRRFTVDVEAKVSSGEHRLVARTRDISRSGLCLITPEPITQGGEISVELVLSFGPNAFSEPLPLTAKVMWCTPLFGSYQVGAMFAALDDDRTAFLDMFMRFLDGTLRPDGIGVPSGGDGFDDIGVDDDDDDDEDREPSPDDKDDPFKT